MPDNIGMAETTQMAMIGALRKVLKRLHHPLEVVIVKLGLMRQDPYPHLQDEAPPRVVMVRSFLR